MFCIARSVLNFVCADEQRESRGTLGLAIGHHPGEFFNIVIPIALWGQESNS